MMLLTRFLRDQSGEVRAEYGLLVSVIAFVFVTGLRMAWPMPSPDLGVISAK